jgi:hypothetical protein
MAKGPAAQPTPSASSPRPRKPRTKETLRSSLSGPGEPCHENTRRAWPGSVSAPLRLCVEQRKMSNAETPRRRGGLHPLRVCGNPSFIGGKARSSIVERHGQGAHATARHDEALLLFLSAPLRLCVTSLFPSSLPHVPTRPRVRGYGMRLFLLERQGGIAYKRANRKGERSRPIPWRAGKAVAGKNAPPRKA